MSEPEFWCKKISEGGYLVKVDGKHYISPNIEQLMQKLTEVMTQ